MCADIECLLMALNAAKFREIVCQHHMDRSFVIAYARKFLKALNQINRDQGRVSDLQDELLTHEYLAKFIAMSRLGRGGSGTMASMESIDLADAANLGEVSMSHSVSA